MFAAEPPWRSDTRPGTSVPGRERPVRRQDDVEHEVADDDDRRAAGGTGGRRRAGDAGDAAGRRRSARIARHRPSIAQRDYNGRPERADRRERDRQMTIATDRLDRLAIDTIRTLSIDAVQKANSGHPGAPMGAAPMAYVLWTRYLRHAPTRPDWPDRDRFVLCAGHASMLLYSLLHLTGYDLTLDELEQFRQWGSRTPGHPEYGLTPGVEATTGPLGQGFANAVGMAIAERRLAAEFNRPGHTIVDHRTYGICSDGDLQEGDRLRGRLARRPPPARQADRCSTTTTTSSSTDRRRWPSARTCSARFDAYGWHTQRVDDGNDLEAIDAAIRTATERRPAEPHRRADPHRLRLAQQAGHPEGPRVAARRRTRSASTKEAYGWDPDRTFYVPDEAAATVPPGDPARRAARRGVGGRGSRRYRGGLPGRGGRAPAPARRRPPAGLGRAACRRTRSARTSPRARPARHAIQALAEPVPELFGGAADLSESNLTDVKGGRRLRGRRARPEPPLRRPRARHGRRSPTASPTTAASSPTAATFLTFSDYMRGSVRLAALSGLHVIYVWTHDSVGLGEDGPTHQPVEHYAALRAIPNLWFVRPGDANEAVAAWALAVERRRRPGALALTRQKLPTLAGTAELAREGVAPRRLRPARGVERRRRTAIDLILIATGSELQLARGGRDALEARGHPDPRRVAARAGSGSSAQDAAYRDEVLPPARPQAGERRGRRLARLGALGRRRGRDHRASTTSGASAPAGDDLRALRLHARSASRTSAGGSSATGCAAGIPTLDPATSRRRT